MTLKSKKRSADAIIICGSGRHCIFECKHSGKSRQIFVEGTSDKSIIRRLFAHGLDAGSYILFDDDCLAVTSLALGSSLEEVPLTEADKISLFGDPKHGLVKGYHILRYKKSHGQIATATTLLKLFMDSAPYEGLIGDLQEGYSQRLRTGGAVGARRWYYQQILLSLWPLLLARVKQVSGLESLFRRIR